MHIMFFIGMCSTKVFLLSEHGMKNKKKKAYDLNIMSKNDGLNMEKKEEKLRNKMVSLAV